MLLDFRKRMNEIAFEYRLRPRTMEQATQMGEGRFGKFLSDPDRNLQIDAFVTAVRYWSSGSRDERKAAHAMLSAIAGQCDMTVADSRYEADGRWEDDVSRFAGVIQEIAGLMQTRSVSPNQVEELRQSIISAANLALAELKAIETPKQKIAGRVASAA